MLRTLAARAGAALAATLPVAAAEQRTEPPRKTTTPPLQRRKTTASSLQRRNSSAPAAQLQRRKTTAQLQRRQTTATPPAKPKPEPTPNTSPRVGVFLDDASRKRLAAKWPDKESPTALFVLDEGLEKRPEMYGSLYGEKATVRVVGADSDGALRGACLCDGTEVKASGATTAVLKVGDAALKPSAEAKKAVEGSSGDPWPPTTEPPLQGTVCRADFWRDETCLAEPSLKCPLCQFMEDSPCAAVFKVWEACLDEVEAKNGEQDLEKKEADFAVACAEPTLALKACVEKYPGYFGEMFGAGEAPAAPASEPTPAP